MKKSRMFKTGKKEFFRFCFYGRLAFLFFIWAAVQAGFYAGGCGGDRSRDEEHSDGGLVPDGEVVPDGDGEVLDVLEDGSGADSGFTPDTVYVTGPVGRIDYEYELDLNNHDHTGGERVYTLAGGTLPGGLELGADGMVAGVPEVSGGYVAVIHGDDDDCTGGICSIEMTLEVEVLPVILVSGFGPFGGIDENPSWGAVEPLDHELIAGHDVRAVMTPVVWDEADEVLLAEYERLKPVIAVASGVAAGEGIIRLESTAVNQAYGTDNNEVFMAGVPIMEDGEEFLYGTIPLAELEAILDQEGYPVGISDYAGDYLCNFIYYKLMHRVAEEDVEKHILGGFVHVPSVDVVSISEMTEAWVLILEYLALHRAELLQKRKSPGQTPYRTSINHPPRY